MRRQGWRYCLVCLLPQRVGHNPHDCPKTQSDVGSEDWASQPRLQQICWRISCIARSILPMLNVVSEWFSFIFLSVWCDCAKALFFILIPDSILFLASLTRDDLQEYKYTKVVTDWSLSPVLWPKNNYRRRPANNNKLARVSNHRLSEIDATTAVVVHGMCIFFSRVSQQ